MAPVDDALDRLVECEREHWAPNPDRRHIAKEFDAALATVRSELEQLREERDDARAMTRIANTRAAQDREAAEAENERLRREREELGPFFVRDIARFVGLPDEASMDEIAERVQRLTEGLRGVANAYGCFAGCTGGLPGAPVDGSGHTPACAAARALLSASPSDGGGA